MKLTTWQIKNAISEHNWEELARLISVLADEPEIYSLYEKLGITQNFLSFSSEPSIHIKIGSKKWSFSRGELLVIKINDMRLNPDTRDYFRVWHKP